MTPDANALLRIDELSDSVSRIKEVYARFGRAVSQAQVLETNIANLLAVTSLLQASEAALAFGQAEFEALYVDLYSHTSGRLVKRLTDAGWPEQYLDLCRLAVSERNRIVHRFHREHPDGFSEVEAMQRMVDDADAAHRLFEQADEITIKLLLGASVIANSREHGRDLTPEQVLAEADRLLDEASGSS
jgi:hypothetical protein